jgi:two-component system, chemotaxis family, CheB/CheR fusion protein
MVRESGDEGERAQSKRRLLLVEDDPFSRRALERLLNREGYAVDACEDSAQALELLGRQAYDVLLTDHVLPGMTGLALAGVCKDLHPGTRCVVMSGHPEPPEFERAHVTWLGKPLELDGLLVALGR